MATKITIVDAARCADYPGIISYWPGCLPCVGCTAITDEERAADRKEQDELLDEWYRTEECPYDK